MDCIIVRDLMFSGRHGVTEQERSLPQRIQVSIIVYADLSKAATSGCIEQTINYSKIKKEVADVITNRSFALLEGIGIEIIGRIINHPLTHRVVVEISKPDIWDNGVPTVIMSRRKSKTA